MPDLFLILLICSRINKRKNVLPSGKQKNKYLTTFVKSYQIIFLLNNKLKDILICKLGWLLRFKFFTGKPILAISLQCKVLLKRLFYFQPSSPHYYFISPCSCSMVSGNATILLVFASTKTITGVPNTK